MKKVLAVILVLILLAGGYLFYQRSRAAQFLEEFSKNQTFLGMGFSLEIFPSSAKVQGWLKPSLNLDRATVSLASFQDVPPQSLVGTRLEVDLFKPGTLRLVSPKITPDDSGSSVDGLYFILKSDKTISEVGIDSVLFKEKKTPDEVLIARQLRFEMGSWVGFIPDKVIWEVQKVEFKKGDLTQASIDPIQVSLDSEKKGDSRHWKVNFAGKGGSFHPEAEVDASLKPWQFSVEGSAHDLPKETVLNFVKDFSVKVKELIKSAPESEPSAAPDFQKFLDPYEQLVNFLVSLGIQPETSQMSWGGFALKAKDGIEVELQPSSGKGAFTYQTDSFKGDSDWNIDGLKVKTKDSNFDLKGLGFSYKGEYHLSYANLLKDILAYYKHIVLTTIQNPLANNPLTYLASAYAYYPDAAVYELKLSSLSYTSPQASGDHRNIVLGFKSDAQGMGYYISDAFDQKFAKDPSFDIKDGKFDLNFKNILPWEKYLKVARAFASGESQNLSLADAFTGEKGGLDWKIDANGGTNWFAAKVALSLQDELGKYVQIYQTSMVPKPDEPVSDLEKVFAMNSLKEFLSKGTLDLSVNIDRFSRFQAFLDKMEPGSSMGLMVIGPYVVMDSKADTLSAALTLKDGKVLLNGKPNAQIDQILQQVH